MLYGKICGFEFDILTSKVYNQIQERDCNILPKTLAVKIMSTINV